MDVASLLAFLCVTCALQGGLLLSLRIPGSALRWFGLAYLSCATAMLLVLLRASGAPVVLTIVLAVAVLIWSFGCIWQGLRIFDYGRASLWPLFVGPAIWIAACLNPAFLASVHARTTFSAWLEAGYALLSARQAWIGRHEPLPSRPFVLVVLALFAALAVARAVFSHYYAFPVDLTAPTTTYPIGYMMLVALLVLNIGCLLAVSLAYERNEAHRFRIAFLSTVSNLVSPEELEARATQFLADTTPGDPPASLLVVRFDRRGLLSSLRGGRRDNQRTVQRLGGWLAQEAKLNGWVGLSGEAAVAWLLPGADEAAAQRLAEDMCSAYVRLGGSAASDRSGVVMRLGRACSTQTGRSFAALLAGAHTALLQGAAGAHRCPG